MKSPFTGKEMKAFHEIREMTFRKEQFQVVFHYYKCEDTGEQFEDDHFSGLNYMQVVNQYRVNHHMPFPEDIVKIRNKYKLSAAKMSSILGMGANSWRNYEAGEVPSKVHSNLIQIIKDPSNFKQHIEVNSELSDKERNVLLDKIEKLQHDHCCCNDPLLRFETAPDIFSGFKTFDQEKIKQAVLFFAENLKPYKTKMNKLLFYADFIHFRDFAQSITGLRYQAIPYGPVPSHYDFIFDVLASESVIDKEFTMTENGMIEQFLSNEKFNSSLFHQSELNSLKKAATVFKGVSASEIAEISHKEKAWQDNINGKKLIPFYYAFDLKTI